jgi:hypothetical protein
MDRDMKTWKGNRNGAIAFAVFGVLTMVLIPLNAPDRWDIHWNYLPLIAAVTAALVCMAVYCQSNINKLKKRKQAWNS